MTRITDQLVLLPKLGRSIASLLSASAPTGTHPAGRGSLPPSDVPLLLSTIEVDLLQLTVESLLAGATGDEARWGRHVATTLTRLISADTGVLALGANGGVRVYGDGAERSDCRAIVELSAPPVADVAVGAARPSGARTWIADATTLRALAGDRAPHAVASLWLLEPQHGTFARFVACFPTTAGTAALQRARSILEIVRPAFTAAVRVHDSGEVAEVGDTMAPAQRCAMVARSLRERYGLTARETDVASLLLQGKANVDIARALVISESTARHHTERVLDKLGVHSRAEVPGLVFGQGTPSNGIPAIARPDLNRSPRAR